MLVSLPLHSAAVSPHSQARRKIDSLRPLSHLFGPCRFHLLQLVGLHLGLHLLPVLAHGALLGSQPRGLFAGLPGGGDVALALLRQRLGSLTCG